MKFIIYSIVITMPVSMFIKNRTINLLLKDLQKRNLGLRDITLEKVDNILTNKLLKFKDFHYYIPGSNIIITLLYYFSYYLKKNEILRELTETDKIIDLSNLNQKEDEINEEPSSNDNKHIKRILEIFNQRDNLEKTKKDLFDQREQTLNHHK